MNKAVPLLVLFLAVTPAFAAKSCDELKTEISAKIDGKGVKSYQLDILDADKVKDQTVVGTCEAGKKKITYTKGAAAATPEKKTEAKKASK